MKEYFQIEELVCEHVLNKFGDRAWAFFDPRLLDVMSWLRKTIDIPIVINSKERGYTQRGLRCNLCSLVSGKTIIKELYMSAHVRGQAFDFNVIGKTSEWVRGWISARSLALPHAIRLESAVTWVHLDVCNDGVERIVYF